MESMTAVARTLLSSLLLMRGTRESSMVNTVIVVVKVAIVVLFIACGWGFINPANTTPFWVTPNGDSAQTTNAPEVGAVMATACTMTGLHMRLYGVAGTAGIDTVTVTVYKNRAATAMTVNATNPAANTFQALASDTINTVPFAVGDTISLGITQTSGAPALRIAIGMRCQ